MTLHYSVIIRLCMEIEYNDLFFFFFYNNAVMQCRVYSYRIVQNEGKNNKIDLTFIVACITCVFMVFGGVSERF